MKINGKTMRGAGALALGAALMASCAATDAATKPAATTQKAKPKAPAKTAQKVKPIKKDVAPVLNFTMKSLGGKDVPLSNYAGKVVMIVNTASKCGFTPQYAGLEKLHEKYAKEGLAILGFPANDFGQQEPGNDREISTFCTVNYGVTFDMFSKVAVTGDAKTPLYQYLTSEKTDPQFPGEVGWNFEKFLIGRDGKILARFKSNVAPEAPELVSAVEAALKK